MKRFVIKYKFFIILFFLIFIVGFIIIFKFSLIRGKRNVSVIEHDAISKEIEVNEDENVFSFAEIKGAVNVPGVYAINDNDRVTNFIDKAGGLREDANVSLINLSKKVIDEMVIIIYTNDEVNNNNSFNTLYKEIDMECVCPSVKNDGCLYKDETGINSNFSESSGLNSSNGKVNINTANLDDLMSISGIGETKAKAIIAYRDEHGNFEIIDDIMNVSGIGQSTFDKIKENITV